jgi:hypothetical protein
MVLAIEGERIAEDHQPPAADGAVRRLGLLVAVED